MILSHKHKFIFIKTEKTAGTSVEITLSRYCGEEDIITPISESDERIRQEFGAYPRNFLKPFHERAFLYLKWKLFNGNKPRMERFWNHIPAGITRKIVGKRVWNDYFTFCFIRNPFDEILSRYYWLLHLDRNLSSLNDFILNYKDFNRNDLFYMDREEMIVDYVARYEDIDSELRKISSIIGIDYDGWLPKAKGQIRRDKRSYEEILTTNQIDIIKTHTEKTLIKYYPELLN